MLLTIDLNDQISEAINLGTAPGQTDASINPADDVDMYRFTVQAGQRVGFDIDRPTGGRLDSYIRLFNGQGTQLSFNDDGAAPGESASLESYLEYTFATGGTYYLGVSGFGNSNYNPITGNGDSNGSTGDYSLILTDLSADTDDQISEAISLGSTDVSITRSGAISVGQDVDMYSFTVGSTRVVSIDLDRPAGSSLDSYLRLFRADGTQIAFNDDGPTPGESASVESYLSLTLDAGTYYVGVSGYGNSNYNAITGTGDGNGSTGSYTLIVTADVDPDDAINQANNLGTISNTIQQTGFTIDNPRDVDMFRFVVTAGQRVTFNINRPSGNFDSYIRLFNEQGTQLASNDDGPTPGESVSVESYLDFTFNTAGTYFLSVSGYGNSTFNALTGDGDNVGSTGAYSLVVTPVTQTPPTDGSRILYMNFDGANISRTDLVRWAGNDWQGMVNYFDADQNGVTVQRFLSDRADREEVITRLMTLVQADLSPFGIQVRRITGGAVEGQRATTLFFGQSSLSNGGYHIACDVDFGNNNQTDIAFVGNENWGSASDTGLALADVALHEAGHTFGLYHVNSGNASESMGLRYSTTQDQWLRDTAFMDQAFPEYSNHGGGRGPQNSFRTMRNTFSGSGNLSIGNVVAGNPLTPEQVADILLGCDDHDHHHHDSDEVVARVSDDSIRTQALQEAIVSLNQTRDDSADRLTAHVDQTSEATRDSDLVRIATSSRTSEADLWSSLMSELNRLS